MVTPASNILEQFARTTEEVVTLQELKELLSSGKQLRIKYGVDVTAPYLHTGHAVNLWMMRMLQDLGHKLQFLIGDTTTRIGDPSRRNALRPIIPSEEIGVIEVRIGDVFRAGKCTWFRLRVDCL
ncbi:MAG TPA: hypothetical protein VEH81_14390 [Ktedonobacteraceae bacterium]|nr:hypothetical protein [Ktedonobacteraceae bacterium]